MCNAPCLLTQLRRKHLLHECLAAEIGYLRLCGEKGIGARCAHRNLVFHLIGGLKNDIRALIGGRDFDDSKFNRATQGQRAAGSTFKPFVYSAAVRAGHPVTEILDDSPLNPPVKAEIVVAGQVDRQTLPVSLTPR